MESKYDLPNDLMRMKDNKRTTKMWCFLEDGETTNDARLRENPLASPALAA